MSQEVVVTESSAKRLSMRKKNTMLSERNASKVITGVSDEWVELVSLIQHVFECKDRLVGQLWSKTDVLKLIHSGV